ncbi:oncostatin-M-specific receptor subunit beta isoform X1 [Harpia harpyja]|uniref:oncostatin-M-specific receptor subunit beta isoform X1 n=2 Tax=Harpia harpyja TaxID=202280 RepID=UPI0022B1B6C3|nr:oncostatin-M-specific receptor subunit beta isoform X1 [Harpia harpyja]XP_052634782.1 oncostatin-M-specific receptor subunit beta isoform X1 [Harpia harpyja]XP_052634783.1 oncostatin-M-specific receptor subunit beta isoform X1 [Harpia harpyja]XP_052634784.1 oncostatin-M-specific receptor subunit beta isoform X1 [Harpia harpyja]XP_052634785.1 oncostatin-M-specific receptor subunit beta isoform X1 [Harpia harpyja]XP_052634786.1 oncostatin-M-specific receptor subunit beta isoform X1 [Harpia ha
MMNPFMVLAVLLPLRTCYSTYSQQESTVFPVMYLNISKDLALQRLLVEWDVGRSAHDTELAMSFEIQVRQIDETTTVWTEFHNVTLDKSGKPLHWMWNSDLPLECMSHSVRIRSKAEASKIWSQWSLWETVLGLDTSNNSGPQIFPNEKIVEEGSDITFCCIGRKGQIIKEFFLVPAVHVSSHTNSQVGLLTVKNVAHQEVPHISVYCQESCNEEQCYDHAVFFVGKPPDTPNDFSCQTQDVRIVTCTWSQGGDTYLYGRHSPKHTLSEEFSQKMVPCTVSCSEQCSCSWDIGQQRICNITVTVENPLGKKTATDVFDVTHRIYPAAPFQLWEQCTDTEITLYWKHRNKGIEFFCQTEVIQPDGKVELHNSSDAQLHYASITLSGLQPYTEYTARVHCGAAKHFWRWSEWSEARTIRTKEASPSGKLDIWREITPVLGGRNVTLFWKQAPSFRANARSISYEVTWEKVEDGSKPESISFSSVYNSTRISIDNDSYRISIMAKNNVNYSLPSVLIIPRATGTEELKEEQVNGTDDGIFISWEPRHIYDSYVIDWCNFPMLQPCDLQWKRFGPNTSSALINSAAFVPGVRYNFHVYGSVANTASLLEKKTGYLRELPTLLDPVVEKVELTFNAVTLSWDSYPTNKSQFGFVRGYHVYVSPIREDCSLKGSKKHVLPDGSVLCKYTIENPEEKRYTVKHLLSNTKYKLVVKAYTSGGETPIVNFIYIDTPFNSNILYLLVLLVIVPSLVAAICRWKMKWVKECCCPVIPSPNKSKVLSFKEFKISSEKVLKISDCIPDMLAVDNKAEAQKLHPWSQLSSTPTEDKIGGHNSSWIYPNENEERDFTPTPTPQTHTWFENFAYSSHLAVESDPYHIPETLEPSKPELSVVLYQPHYYFDIFNKDAASTPRETAGRKTSLRYISQTDVHCLGRRL